MSILDDYDPAREAVLEPSHAAAPVEGFPETVVVTFQPSLTPLPTAACRRPPWAWMGPSAPPR